MIKFTLETNKGKIALEDAGLTQEQLMEYAKGLGVPSTQKTVAVPKDIEARLEAPQVLKTEDKHAATNYTPAPEAKQETPMPRPAIQRTTVNEDTPVIPAHYDCPHCGDKGTRNTYEWFKFVKCFNCHAKLYLQPEDDTLTLQDPDFVYKAVQPYFTFEERQQHQQEKLEAYETGGASNEKYAAATTFTPDVMDTVYDAAKQSKQALNALDADQLKEYIERSGIPSRNFNDKDSMVQVIYEDVRYQV